MTATDRGAELPPRRLSDVASPGVRLGSAAAISPLLLVALLAVVYFAAAKLGLSMAPQHKSVSLVWPPTGIALAALLLFGYRLWPGIALGALLINVSAGAGLAASAGIATGNTLEAFAGAYLLQRFTRFRQSLERPQDVLEFVVLAAGVAPTLSATVGVASLCLGGAAQWSLYRTLWWQWWLGDAMGALIVTPVLLTWATPSRITGRLGRVGERVALLVLTAAASQIVFGRWFTAAASNSPPAFAVFPFVIWAAMRLGQREVATTTLVVSTIAIWNTARRVGPFLGQTPVESFLLLQAFMSVVAVTALIMGAAIVGRRRIEEALQQSERRYRELFENATAMVYTADLDGRFTSLNRLVEDVSGYPREELLGMSLADLATTAQVELAKGMIARQANQDEPILFELQIVAKTGRPVSLEVNTRRITDEGLAVGMQGVARDITKRKHAELELERANQRLTAWVNELEERTRQTTLLSEMGDLLQSCLTAEEAYRVIGAFAPRLFPLSSGALGVLGPSRNLVEIVASWGEARPADRVFAPDHCWALRRGRAYGLDTPEAGPICGHVHPSLATGYLCVPMVALGDPLGVLHLQGQSGPHESRRLAEPQWESQQRLAVAVAEHLALALANLRLRETLRHQSILDSLTGLFNRRYMEETLTLELARATRSRRAIGIIMLDIDHFKAFNDAYGHDAGDTVLRELGGLLKRMVREGDVACRYGGEEFVLILPEASLELARGRADALRVEVKGLHIVHHGAVIGPITMSAGVAVFPEHGKTTPILLQAADAALYRAKGGGRDRVTVAQ